MNILGYKIFEHLLEILDITKINANNLALTFWIMLILVEVIIILYLRTNPFYDNSDNLFFFLSLNICNIFLSFILSICFMLIPIKFYIITLAILAIKLSIYFLFIHK